MVKYNGGEIVQPFVSDHRKAELKNACRHFKQSYPAILARPRLAWKIIEDYRRATAGRETK